MLKHTAMKAFQSKKDLKCITAITFLNPKLCSLKQNPDYNPALCGSKSQDVSEPILFLCSLAIN